MCSKTCVKITLLFFNIIFLILGLGVLAVGLYVRFVRSELDEFIGSSLIHIATYICIASGGVVVFVSLVGCAGTLLHNRLLLIVYIGCLILVFVMEVSAGVLGFLNHNKVENLLEEHLKPAILTKYGYKENALVTTAVDKLQQELECCGYNKPTDWYQAQYYLDDNATVVTRRGSAIMPVSCCVDKTDDSCNKTPLTVFGLGCKEKVQEIVMDNLIILGCASMGISAFQMLGVVLAFILCQKGGDDDDSLFD